MKTFLTKIQLDDFLAIISDAVILVNGEQEIVYVNQIAETVFGYSAAEICGQHIDILIPERYIQNHINHFQRFKDSASIKRVMVDRREVTASRRDGTEFPIEANIAKLAVGDEQVFAVFLRDISERKRIERDLEKWAQAFEHAEWGVVVGEASTRNLQIMNPAFARMYGYTVQELTGKPIESVYAPSEKHKIESWLKQAHETGHFAFESKHIRRDQTEFPVIVNITAVKDSQGQVIYRVVNVTDVSELKKAERALHENEKQSATIIEVLDESILLVDREGKILTCNASAEKIIGVPREQLLGWSIFNNDWKVIHEDGSECGQLDFPAQTTISSGKVNKNIILGISRTDNPILWVSVSTYPLYHDGDQNLFTALISFVDVTERVLMYRLMEERVKESTRELSALLEISRNLVSTLDLAPLLKIILVQLKMVVNFSGAAIARLSGDEFIILEYLGPVHRDVMLNFHVSAEQDTGYRRVMLSRKPYIIQDIWQDDPWLQSLQQKANTDILDALKPAHSWMGVPLITQDQMLGILRLDHLQPNYFTERDAALVTTFAELAAIAIRNADLYENAQSLAAMEERQKLARELHDSVSQALYGIALGARTARTMLERDPQKASEPLDYCLYLAETGLAEMRALIFELRPESLEKEGLINALTKQINAWKARYQIETSMHFGSEPQISLNIKETIYRISQEALNNVVKHARASKVDIHLDTVNDVLCMEIKDNGRGFDTKADKPGHFGLSSMRERAQRIGATICIESLHGKGTRVRLEINLAAK